ncbi:MAG: baeS [Sphingomonas bacterium]|nr:baeS [Sphingomonas bacterium]
MTTPPSNAAPLRPTVLLVDDEPEILVALEDLLEDGYTTLSASSPLAALALLEANPQISVVVSDQRMPEMTGNIFLARARRISSAEAILLTGYADLSAVISAVNEGAISGYLHKPWEPEALLAMIGAAAERHRLRAALAFEHAAFTALLEQSGDAVSVIDRSHRAVRSNSRAREQRQADPAPTTIAADRAADEAALASGAYADEEQRFDASGKEPRWIRTRRIPFGTGDATRHLIKIESDETERRQAEQKLHQAEKLQALGTLAGGIAHDFNNLLAVVIGNLELATRSRDEAKLARYLASATDAATRGSAISRRLLTFSRQRELTAETFLPSQAIGEIEDLLAQSTAGRASVRLDLGDEVWPIHTDRSQFELAIINLCINARDAMDDGGEIVVATRNADPRDLPSGMAGEFVRISVTDSGSGMSEEIQARVFEPFFTTKPHGRGTGLGLPMVKAMAEAAGGAATIESAPGAGTSIHLWMPHSALPQPAECTVQEAASVGSLGILLAEDDPEVRGMLTEQLSNAGHRITAVHSGEEALERLDRDAAFDLLITDLAMPRISGLELSARVGERWPRLPILLITGFAEVQDELPLAVLTKPFTAEQLQAAVAHAVHGRA